jgi:hypothetical protein
MCGGICASGGKSEGMGPGGVDMIWKWHRDAENERMGWRMEYRAKKLESGQHYSSVGCLVGWDKSELDQGSMLVKTQAHI